MLQLQTLEPNPPLPFHVSIVLINLTLALVTIFILAHLSTLSIVHVCSFIDTWRHAEVIDLKICESNYPCPDVAQTFLSFIDKNAFLETSNDERIEGCPSTKLITMATEFLKPILHCYPLSAISTRKSTCLFYKPKLVFITRRVATVIL